MFITMHQIGNFMVHGHEPMYQARTYRSGRDQGYDFEQNPDPFIQNDPMLDLAYTEEIYHQQMLNAGFDVFKSGFIESAADEQNLRAFMDQPRFENFVQEQVREQKQRQQEEPRKQEMLVDPITATLGGWW